MNRQPDHGLSLASLAVHQRPGLAEGLTPDVLLLSTFIKPVP